MLRQLRPWHENLIQAFAPDQAFFWATHQGAEPDLLLMRGERRVGVEIKREDAPRLTASMKIATSDLQLDHLVVAHPGKKRYALSPDASVWPLAELVATGWRAFPPPRRAVRGRARVPRGSRGSAR